MSNPEASSVVFDREGWFYSLFGKPQYVFSLCYE